MAATPSPLRSLPQTGLPDRAAAPAAGATILDRTAWPRRGLRGPGTAAWCEAAGLPFPGRVNTVARSRGLRIARLGTHELLVLPDSPETAIPAIPSGAHGLFDGYREESWAWFRLEGPQARDLLAGLTSADLRPGNAPADSVVQTRLGHLDAVLVIEGDAATPAIDLFSDIASTGYLLAALRDGRG